MKAAVFSLLFTLVSGSALADEARCISAYGVKACGYSCEAAYGQVKCAQTPYGACTAEYGQLVCWDPPRIPRLRSAPAAQCVAEHGQVKCAETPVAKSKFVRGERKR